MENKYVITPRCIPEESGWTLGEMELIIKKWKSREMQIKQGLYILLVLISAVFITSLLLNIFNEIPDSYLKLFVRSLIIWFLGIAISYPLRWLGGHLAEAISYWTIKDKIPERARMNAFHFVFHKYNGEEKKIVKVRDLVFAVSNIKKIKSMKYDFRNSLYISIEYIKNSGYDVLISPCPLYGLHSPSLSDLTLRGLKIREFCSAGNTIMINFKDNEILIPENFPIKNSKIKKSIREVQEKNEIMNL